MTELRIPAQDGPRIVMSTKRARVYICRPLAERFWAKVDKTPGHGPNGDCWPWTGATDDKGYGQIREAGRGSRLLKAHRVAWVLANGPLADALLLLHSCDYRPCVRDNHLTPGSHSDNSQDAAAKGRLVFQVHPEKCPRGEAAWAARLTAEQVERIRARRAEGWTQTKLAQEFGVSQSAIWSLLAGRTWKATA